MKIKPKYGNTPRLREVLQSYDDDGNMLTREVLEDGKVVESESWLYDEQDRVIFYDTGDGHVYMTEYTLFGDGSTTTRVTHTLDGVPVNVYNRIVDKNNNSTFETDNKSFEYRAAYDKNGRLTYSSTKNLAAEND